MSSSQDPGTPPFVSPSPLSTSLRISAPTCSLAGTPPFTTTTVYTRNTKRPIWALICRFTDYADGIVLRDPNHWKAPDRRIGCTLTTQDEDVDQEEVDRQDSALVRLEPGEKFETFYTFSVTMKQGGMHHSDTKYMKAGGVYFVELRRRKCFWMYEDEMEEILGDQERREVLGKCRPVEWVPDCRVDFTATE